jgi:pyruvate ferredoxin oxidoreductase gamma subunit
MISIRFHGRGGQGVVTAAELLALAAFHEGKFAQAFPSFGSERTGAPVMAFCRLDERPIRLREPVLAPEIVVIQDPTLLHAVPVFQGLAPDGHVLINTSRSLAELGLEPWAAARPAGRTVTVAATEIARTQLGKPLPNVALLGALAGVCGLVTLASIGRALRERFPGELAEQNLAAAVAAFEQVGGLVGRRAADRSPARVPC